MTILYQKKNAKSVLFCCRLSRAAAKYLSDTICMETASRTMAAHFPQKRKGLPERTTLSPHKEVEFMKLKIALIMTAR
jgi:hypothetical protein